MHDALRAGRSEAELVTAAQEVLSSATDVAVCQLSARIGCLRHRSIPFITGSKVSGVLIA